MRNITISIVCFIIPGLLFIESAAQSPFIPENLSLASGSEYTEVNPVLSVDGKTLFFNRINHPENRYGEKNSQDIWYRYLQENGQWSPAERMPDNVNIGRYNAILSALGDGKSYFILGKFSRKGTFRTGNGYSIIERTGNNEWSNPRPVKVNRYNKKSRGNAASGYMTPYGEMIIHSFAKRYNKNRLSLFISMLEQTNNYEKPKYEKPKEIKIERYEGRKARSLEAPFLTADKNRLYFSGNFSKDREKRSIYYIDRLDETYRNWSAPVKLSDTINGAHWNSYFRMNAGENWAWYSSVSEQTGKAGIFRVKLFEENPFVEVKGLMADTLTGKPIPISRNPMVLLNGELSDSVVFDRLSGTFHALLPLGERYIFTGTGDNFESKPVMVDVSQEDTFSEREVNIFLSSFPWVELSGQVVDNRSNSPIDSKFRPVFLINGKSADSVYIDPLNGNYTVNLPIGADWMLGVSADNYTTGEVHVDLTSYGGYAALTQDILAERKDFNMVTLKGRIINTKTGKQLEPGYDVRMHVNGALFPDFDYDHVNASYTFMLPVGYNYDLVPGLINFYNRLEPVDLTSAEPMSTINRNFYVAPLEIGQSVEIENIYFETGKSVLMPESFRSLNALVEFLKEYPNVVVEIGGHTDNVGSAAINQKLSAERALAVAEYVVSRGISAQRVVSRGYGFSKPVASNQTGEGRTRNRRVDFTITGL